MDKDIKNKILESASHTGNTKEQKVDYELLPYVIEVYKDGYINYLQIEDTDIKYIQVTLNEQGKVFFYKGGYK